jgi:GNAT superfamily N-acetyltransferase
MRAMPFASARLAFRLRRWWAARSMPLRQIDVRARDRTDAAILEAFVGHVRVGRLIATQTAHLPAEEWADAVPKHDLPMYWVSECLVDARFRNRGVGRRLVTKLVELAFTRHPDALVVGWANSTQARRFAAELGFNVRDEAAYASLGSVAGRLLA